MHDSRKHDAILWLVVFIACLVLSSMAYGEGIVKQSGDPLTYNCTLPTEYVDGSPIPAGTSFTVTAYATQSPPTVGEPLGTGGCPLTVDTSGLPSGQYQAYITVTAEGHDVSPLSNAVPFYLDPAASISTRAGRLDSLE